MDYLEHRIAELVTELVSKHDRTVRAAAFREAAEMCMPYFMPGRGWSTAETLAQQFDAKADEIEKGGE